MDAKEYLEKNKTDIETGDGLTNTKDSEYYEPENQEDLVLEGMMEV